MPDSPTPSVWGYNGEQYDSDTGLIYLRARYYNPSISRFEQEDAWGGLLTENNSLNRYDYCYNNPVIYHDDGGHIPIEGVYGRGNYGRTYSSSIATVTSYRESNNIDDSDGYDFAETGIPNINNSTASNNSNLVFNPYSDVIGPEKATREQMIYICEEYARIMAEEEESLVVYNEEELENAFDEDDFTVAILVQQPVEEETMVVNETFDVGHTFIMLDMGDENEQYWGFYPNSQLGKTDILSPEDIPGRINTKTSPEPSEDTHSWNIGEVYVINEEQASILMEYANNYDESYNIISNNCTTFAVKALEEIGIDTGISEDDWDVPDWTESALSLLPDTDSSIYYGYTPSNAGEDIRNE